MKENLNPLLIMDFPTNQNRITIQLIMEKLTMESIELIICCWNFRNPKWRTSHFYLDNNNNNNNMFLLQPQPRKEEIGFVKSVPLTPEDRKLHGQRISSEESPTLDDKVALSLTFSFHLLRLSTKLHNSWNRCSRYLRVGYWPAAFLSLRFVFVTIYWKNIGTKANISTNL